MSKINFKPLADRVLIEPALAEENTPSGIIIPDTAKEKPHHGTVVAVGPGTKKEKMTLRKGDEILYGRNSGTEIQFNAKTYLIMKAKDIYGVINSDELINSEEELGEHFGE